MSQNVAFYVVQLQIIDILKFKYNVLLMIAEPLGYYSES